MNTIPEWNLSNLFDKTEKCLIILNCPIQHWKLFKSIWDAATLRICVDGGANRLLDAASKHADPVSFTPHLLVGDFDSLTAQTRQFYTHLNVDMHFNPDQHSTDYMKAFNYVPRHHIAITFGGLSGRLDQTVHTLSYTRSQQNKRDRAVYVISENNIAWSLSPGTHHIRAELDKFGECCGILPIATKWARVTTQGLEWDLGGPGLEVTGFDGIVSSSNHLKSELVQLTTDEHIYFNVEIRDSLLS